MSLCRPSMSPLPHVLWMTGFLLGDIGDRGFYLKAVKYIMMYLEKSLHGHGEWHSLRCSWGIGAGGSLPHVPRHDSLPTAPWGDGAPRGDARGLRAGQEHSKQQGCSQGFAQHPNVGLCSFGGLRERQEERAPHRCEQASRMEGLSPSPAPPGHGSPPHRSIRTSSHVSPPINY